MREPHDARADDHNATVIDWRSTDDDVLRTVR
jgi:hypothetical protein